ncbi:hypothetical protein ACP4OV_022665 [Aristida adscensionis]
MAQREEGAAKPARGGAGRRHGHVVAMEVRGGEEGKEEEGATWGCGATAAGVAAVGLAGAGVLVWWAVAFHPARQQLWMVPVGLVLLGTPLIAWLSLLASGSCRWLRTLRGGAAADRPPLAPET